MAAFRWILLGSISGCVFWPGVIGFSAFQPDIRHSLFLYSSALPPPMDQAPVGTKRKPNRRRPSTQQKQPWTGPSIPDRIPSLSEILYDGPASLNSKQKQKETTTSQRKRSAEPWKAEYYTSIKSQKKIQSAANLSRVPHERAIAVLETFLGIPSHKCNTSNIVCALTLSAKVLGRSSPPRFQDLLFQVTDILYGQVEYLSARQLCNVLWALAKFYDRDNSILPSSQQAVSDDTHFGIAETWDLSNDGHTERLDDCIDQISTRLVQVLDDDLSAAKPGELCMASWGYSVLRKRRRPAGWEHEKRLGKLPSSKTAKKVNRDMLKFEQWDSPEQASDISETDSSTGIVLDKIGEALCHPIDPDNPDSDTCIRSCQWQELANVAWAFASHGRARSVGAVNTITAISKETTRRLSQGGQDARTALSRDIAQLIWSLGVLQADNFQLADCLVDFVEAAAIYFEDDLNSRRPFARWSCADIVQVVLSLARARLDETTLVKSLYSEALERLSMGELKVDLSGGDRKSFLTWELSILLWAQARFNLTNEQGAVFDEFGKKAVSSLNSALKTSFSDIGIGPQEQANIAWSLTVLELYNSAEAVRILDKIFVETAESCRSAGVIQLEHAHQLWQAIFLLGHECPRCVERVPKWFLQYLKEKWNLEKARPKVSSARHKSISRALKSMGVDHRNEHDEDIDVAIVLKPNASWTSETGECFSNDGMKVAVEFDGPYHFTRQRNSVDSGVVEPPRALGHTVLKYRILKQQGWTVVRVPYFEYDKIPFWSSMERMRYLQRLLKTHGNLRFSSADVSNYKALVPNRKSRFD